MKDDSGLGEPASPSTGEARTQAVGLWQLYRWLAPWVVGAVLVAAALLGLYAASRARSSADSAAGFATFALAVLALIRGIRNYFAGVGIGARPPAPVADPGTLLLLIILLTGLAILGLVLAARGPDPLWQLIGYALFAASLALIAWNLKRYFDAEQRRR